MFLSWAQKMLQRALPRSKPATNEALASVTSARPPNQQQQRRTVAASAARPSGGDLVYSVVHSPSHVLPGHVETPARVAGVLRSLAAAGLRGDGPLATRAQELPAQRLATPEELAMVHTYLADLKRKAAVATEAAPLAIADLGDPDGVTFLTETSLEDARRAAGTALDLVDAVMTSTASPPPAAFGIVRPPGHHATPSTPLGYCIFNNVALAARHAQQAHRLQRVMVLDFDVHNGNGTCEAFWEDPSVLVIDAHEASATYPSPEFVPAGEADVGGGEGRGATINIPMPRYAGHRCIMAAFECIIAPAARRFQPDIILVSAGYDAHVLDPFQLLQYRSSSYHALAAALAALAAELCGGRLVFLLEGGYDVAALGEAVGETWLALLGEPSREAAAALVLPQPEPMAEMQALIAQLRTIHAL